MSMIPFCQECQGAFACLGCGSLLRKKLPSGDVPNVWGSARVREYLEALRDNVPYSPTFATGRRKGALLDLGDGNQLECFLPYVDEQTDDTLPYMPMELDGSIVHDPGRGKPATAWQHEDCKRGKCRCDSRPTGWKLTRPLLRGLLGVSDSFLSEHGRDLPGTLPCWCLCIVTPVFMKEVIFNVEFRFPTRSAARAARADREARRCEAPRPNGRWSSRPRRR